MAIDRGTTIEFTTGGSTIELQSDADDDPIRVQLPIVGDPSTVTPRWGTYVAAMALESDAEHGITAMMRTTGYTLSITAQLQVRGVVAPGVHTPDECIPPAQYFAMLAERGVMVREVAAA